MTIPAIFFVLMTFIFTTPARAEEKLNVAALGGGISQNSEPFGWGAFVFDSPIVPGGMVQYAGFDVYAASSGFVGTPLTVGGIDLVYSAYTGLAKQIAEFGRNDDFSIYGLFAPGVITNGTNTEFRALYGGLVHYKINDTFGALVGLEGSYDRINEADFKPKFGVSIKF